jgi:Domain of unknown function (DUF4138)
MKKVLIICLVAFSMRVSAQRNITIDHVKLSLTGIFISGHTLSFDMMLFNHSLLGYEPQYIKFFIRERHVVTRTAVQEREIRPIALVKSSEIPADSSLHIILNFYPFTISDKKELVIAVKEKNGARDLELHIAGRRLLRMIRIRTEEPNNISLNNKNQVYE